jgi:hypothetical protein
MRSTCSRRPPLHLLGKSGPRAMKDSDCLQTQTGAGSRSANLPGIRKPPFVGDCLVRCHELEIHCKSLPSLETHAKSPRRKWNAKKLPAFLPGVSAAWRGGLFRSGPERLPGRDRFAKIIDSSGRFGFEAPRTTKNPNRRDFLWLSPIPADHIASLNTRDIKPHLCHTRKTDRTLSEFRQTVVGQQQPARLEHRAGIL